MSSSSPTPAPGPDPSRAAAAPPDAGAAADSLALARRTAAFVAELGDAGEVGRVLAGRAAVLSIRLERAAERELVVVAAGMAAGRAEFDRARAAELAPLVGALDRPGDPRPALEALAASPAGVEHLLGAWRELRGGLLAGDPAAEVRARRYLGLDPAAPFAAGDLAARAAAEVDRLAALARALAPAAAAAAAARRAAGLLAAFDPDPAAAQARRHEAAAERGLHRALKAIAEIRRARAQVLGMADAGPDAGPPPRRSPAAPPDPAAELVASLASFRAGAVAAGARPVETVAVAAGAAPPPPEARKKRPDYRQLDRKRR